MAYSGDGGHLKATFQVGPGADPRQIRLAYQGADGVSLTGAGRLAVSTPAGGFEEEAPTVYQEIDGRRVSVEARYTLAQAGAGEWRYGFALGAYDPARPLVIDPAILVYAGYIGGSGWDVGKGIAVDGLGQAYVVGTTSSTETGFPVRGGPDLTFNGGGDAFVAKVSADGTQLVYAGYIGGSGTDSGNGIAVDGLGQAFVIGTTYSMQASFPVRIGPTLRHSGGYWKGFVVFPDAFVAKVSADGSQLVYAGYIGGGRVDVGADIAVDGLGQAYVVGTTESSEYFYGFPLRVGPDLTYNGPDHWGLYENLDGGDAFVAKVSADGTQLVYAGYIGGSTWDVGSGIAVDDLGQAYVVGTTSSEEYHGFPVRIGPDLTFNGPEDNGTNSFFRSDAFVAKISADGSQLVYAGYIGGNGYDRGNGIAVDGLGQVHVVGSTGSTEASFPVRGGPDLTFNGSYEDAFVAKVSADGSQLVYAGYIGGSGDDSGHGIAVDGLGQAYVVGRTASTEASFPVRGGPDLTFNGNGDVFVAKLYAEYIQPPATLTLSASPATVGQQGSSTLTWSSAYVASCTASGGWWGAQPVSGRAVVSPAATQTYTLACTGSGGAVSQSVTVAVSPPPFSSADCLFNWAERSYPSLFVPADSPSAIWDAYTYYRHYPASNTNLIFSRLDDHVYYTGPDGQLQDEGPLQYWLPLAGCR